MSRTRGRAGQRGPAGWFRDGSFFLVDKVRGLPSTAAGGTEQVWGWGAAPGRACYNNLGSGGAVPPAGGTVEAVRSGWIPDVF
jgi:hypothetical protein